MLSPISGVQSTEALGSGPVWVQGLTALHSSSAQLLLSHLVLSCLLHSPKEAVPLLPTGPQAAWGKVPGLSLTEQQDAILGCLDLCLLVGAAARAAQTRSLSPQDNQIAQERASQSISGGCCALAAVYLMGKFYVANAGDSRYSPRPSPRTGACPSVRAVRSWAVWGRAGAARATCGLATSPEDSVLCRAVPCRASPYSPCLPGALRGCRISS